MRCIYTFLVAIFLITSVNAQIEFAPLNGNPILRSHVAKQNLNSTLENEDFTATIKMDCPPNLPYFNIVEADETKIFNIDTTGSALQGDSINNVTFLANCSVNQGGTVATNIMNSDGDITSQFTYTANGNVTVAFDTICIEICTYNNGCETFKVGVLSRRKGTTSTATGPTLMAYATENSYCVETGSLVGELFCSEILDCADDYDGEGQQFVYLTGGTPTSCLAYEASGFPGTDVVCVQLCDEYGICDTVNVSYTITGETLNLPFFDDFSGDTGVYPSTANWLDRDVYVNNTFAPHPPSVGMVTFDGLDRNGAPYTETNAKDKLTSKHINLSSFNTNNNIYFKCYVANKGYGLSPESSDKLVLEFRDNTGQWNTINEWTGINGSVPFDEFPFEFFAVKIEDAIYFHDAFQFRFSAGSTPAGITDLWQLDYIKIEENNDDTAFYQDLAFTNIPADLLSRYSAMPWEQFKANISGELRNDGIVSSYFNHKNQASNLSAGSSAVVKDLQTGNNFNVNLTVTNATSINTLEYKTITNNDNTSTFWEGMVSELSAYPANTEKAELAFEYSYSFPNQSDIPLVLANDKVSSSTVLDNYYAYDDGTAERTVILVNEQNDQPQIAIRFHTNTTADLRGLMLQFPWLKADLSTQVFNLKVWVDASGSNDHSYLNNNEPDYVREFLMPYYLNNTLDTLQGFTTYALENTEGEATPLTIPAGADFYIGFQQYSITNQGVPIGFDMQNDAREHTFVSLGGAFNPIPLEFKGSIIYRPIFGTETPIDSKVTETSNINPFSLYPNPTNGKLNINFKTSNYNNYTIRIYNNVGQMLRTEKASPSLDISEFSAGVYMLEMQNPKTGESHFEKVILTK